MARPVLNTEDKWRNFKIGSWPPDRIAQALDRTPVKAIRHWVQTHLGLTHHTQRRLAYAETD